jgi:hypothetical protein
VSLGTPNGQFKALLLPWLARLLLIQ